MSGIMRVCRLGNVSFYLQRNQGILLCITICTALIALKNLFSDTWPTPLHHLSVSKDDNSCAVHSLLQWKGVTVNLDYEDVSNVSTCEVFSLLHQSNYTLQSEVSRGSCQRVLPVPGSCDVAKNIFFSDPPPSCPEDVQQVNFCQVEDLLSKNRQVKCNATIISSVCSTPIAIGLHNISGLLEWTEFSSASVLSSTLTNLSRGLRYQSFSRHYGFSFIRCERSSSASKRVTVEYDSYYGSRDASCDYGDCSVYAEQLLILPPLLKATKFKKKPSHTPTINFNLVLVDSVSRQHFYRSLKKSISVLERLNGNKESPAAVFDFELVQSVKSRTFESLQTLFSGDVDPESNPFGTQEIPPKPLDLSVLFKTLKSKDYNTLWLEDLCYLWEWGLSKDLHFLNLSSSEQDTWKRMWNRLANNSVDSIDITLAMCRILETCGVKDGFHGPDSICFNSRHQHEYLLEYLLLYQQTLDSENIPWFTFTMTNVGHEGTGRRIQTLDHALSQYIEAAAAQSNTLTILFSDHGNSYGKFIDESTEAQVELFHPVLFFVVPNGVAKILGEDSLKSLSLNSQRLVTLLDLHYTLTNLISPGWKVSEKNKKFDVSEKGLLEPVSKRRTCNNLPLIPPNTCICESFEQEVIDDSGQELLAYFAISQLNAEIQRQFKKSISDGNETNMPAFGNCARLSLVGFRNVRVNMNKNGETVLKMDLLTQKSSISSVAMTIIENTYNNGCRGKITVNKFDRLTRYGQYSKCADNIDLSLCICDASKSSLTSQTDKEYNNLYKKFNNVHSIQDIINNTKTYLLPRFGLTVSQILCGGDCLFVFIYQHAFGYFLSIMNVCKTEVFSINMSTTRTSNFGQMYYLSPKSFNVTPGGDVPLTLVFNSVWSIQEKRQHPAPEITSCQVGESNSLQRKELHLVLNFF